MLHEVRHGGSILDHGQPPLVFDVVAVDCLPPRAGAGKLYRTVEMSGQCFVPLHVVVLATVE
jgi:hypothetical protein